MEEQWPSPGVAYHYPERTDENKARWVDAIARAWDNGTLTLTSLDEKAKIYRLAGACPRCNHQFSTTIEYDVVEGVLPTGADEFNIDCSCSEEHAGSPYGSEGCGWGGWIPVPIDAGEHVS